jgi:hypothetical protein
MRGLKAAGGLLATDPGQALIIYSPSKKLAERVLTIVGGDETRGGVRIECNP